jgi:hypothetical protein
MASENNTGKKPKTIYHRIEDETNIKIYKLLTKEEKFNYKEYLLGKYNSGNIISGRYGKYEKDGDQIFNEWIDQDENRKYLKEKFDNHFFDGWETHDIILFKKILEDGQLRQKELDTIDLEMLEVIKNFFYPTYKKTRKSRSKSKSKRRSNSKSKSKNRSKSFSSKKSASTGATKGGKTMKKKLY